MDSSNQQYIAIGLSPLRDITIPHDGIYYIFVYSRYDGGTSTYLVTTEIQSVPNSPTLITFEINNEASTTTSRVVTLDNTSSNNPTHYIASEDPRFSGASWQTYSTSPSFTLSAEYGTKTVYLKVKNSEGVSNLGFDTIVYVSPSSLTGDFDNDGEVGLSDFVLFLDVFGATTSSADWNPVFDLDGNGEIGLSDFVIFLDNFGRTA